MWRTVAATLVILSVLLSSCGSESTEPDPIEGGTVILKNLLYLSVIQRGLDIDFYIDGTNHGRVPYGSSKTYSVTDGQHTFKITESPGQAASIVPITGTFTVTGGGVLNLLLDEEALHYW